MSIDLHQIGEVPLGFAEDLYLGMEILDPDIIAGPMEMHLEGQIMAIEEYHYLQAAFRASGNLLCTRCLNSVPWQGEGEFAVEVRPPLDGRVDEIELEGKELDVIFLEGSELKLEELAAEQLLLEIPMRVLCKPDCAGLCPRCGKNKNIEGACRCEPEIDPRWEALKSIKEKSS